MEKNNQSIELSSLDKEKLYEKILPIFKKSLLEELGKKTEIQEEDITKFSLEELITSIDYSDLSDEEIIIVEQAKKDLNITDQDSLNREELKNQYKDDEEKLGAIDALQAALDIAGFEPTVGSFADGANALIYAIKSAKSLFIGEGKQAKEHILDAGISALSLIPFADVIKVLRLRKIPKLAKMTIAGGRKAKQYGKIKKIDRVEEKTGYQHKIAA